MSNPWSGWTQEDHLKVADQHRDLAHEVGGMMLNAVTLEAIEAAHGTLSAWLGDRRAEFEPFIPWTSYGHLFSLKEEEHSPEECTVAMTVETGQHGIVVFCWEHGAVHAERGGSDEEADAAGLAMLWHVLTYPDCAGEVKLVSTVQAIALGSRRATRITDD